MPEFVSAASKVLFLAVGLRAALLLWGRRPRVAWRRSGKAEELDVLDHVAELVAADAETQRRALQTGAARNAIVACWLRLEALIEAAGYDRDPAATTAEFTSRVLTRFAVDDQAVDQLAALYREARFSSHPMGEADRTAAIVALESIHAGLRRDEVKSAL